MAIHISDNGTVTKQQKATETGVKTFKCTVCGYVMNTETIPATGTPTIPVTPPYVPSIPSNPTTSATTSTSKEPFIQGDNGKTGWDAISDTISNTPEGGTITVDMNNTTKLPKDIVFKIKGRNIDLVLVMDNGFVWTINGRSVTSAKTVDMKVRKAAKIPKYVIDEYFGDLETIQIDLSHNGDFGFIAELTIDLGSKYNGMYANSYCYKSRKFEFGDSAEISNGKVKLRFAHASNWLITVESSPVLEDVSSAAAAHSSGTPIDMSNSASRSIIRHIVKECIAYAGIDVKERKHGPHALRSSLASNLVSDGTSYDAVRKILGHTDPDAVKHYVKTDIERLRTCALAPPKPTGIFLDAYVSTAIADRREYGKKGKAV